MAEDLTGPLGERVFVERSPEDIWIDRRIQHMRMADDGAGKPWGAAKNFSEQLTNRRIGFQHQKQFGGRWHSGKRGIQTSKRGVGIARPGEGLQEQGDQFGQDFPCSRAAHGGAAAKMPTPDGFDGKGRLFEAQTQQCFERLGILRGARENQAASRDIESWRMFKQALIMMRDKPQAMRHFAAKAAFLRIAAKSREAPQRVFVGRQPLSLLIVDHLQPVFDLPQEQIGRPQVGDRVLRHPALVAKLLQHVEGARSSQARPLTAENQLLGLHEKLNFANAAAPQFYIVTGDRNLAMTP